MYEEREREEGIPEQAEQPIIDALEDAGHAEQRRRARIRSGEVLALLLRGSVECDIIIMAAVLARLARQKAE